VTKQELIEKIKETIQIENLTEDMRLSTLAELDSLAIIGIMSLYDNLLSVNLTTEMLRNCNTIGDLIKIVEDKLLG
jgi:acyl carrier protein